MSIAFIWIFIYNLSIGFEIVGIYGDWQLRDAGMVIVECRFEHSVSLLRVGLSVYLSI